MRPLARIALSLILAFAAPATAQPSNRAPSPSPDELNAIGHAMVELVGTQDAKILLYAEVRGSDLLFETRYVRDGDPAAQRAVPTDNVLLGAVASAWRSAHDRMGDSVWRALVYRLDHGHVTVRPLCVGDYDPDVSFDDRFAVELRWLGGAP